MGSSERMQEVAGRFISKDLAVVEQVAREQGVELGRLGTTVDRLAAIEEIKQLKARYFRFIDTKDWAASAICSPRIASTTSQKNRRRPS